MGVLNISIPMAKQRALAKAILAVTAVTAFIVRCSSAAAPDRPTAVPGSPAPPTADISATVDAKVRQRLANATTYTPGVPGTRSPTSTQLSSPTAGAGDPTPAVGGSRGNRNTRANGTLTPTPTISLTPTVMPTPTSMPTATIVPTPTPTFDDDHGDTAVFATIITFEESPTILSGELDVLDDIDYFAISNTEPGKTWAFTPEDLPPETSSGRYPPIAISGTSTVPDPFTGVISFQPGGSTLILSMTSKKFPKTGDYRIVVDRTGN